MGLSENRTPKKLMLYHHFLRLKIGGGIPKKVSDEIMWITTGGVWTSRMNLGRALECGPV
jgi:hypothetical protein